jgi:tetratricopeptide (TPR) repeat protein
MKQKKFKLTLCLLLFGFLSFAQKGEFASKSNAQAKIQAAAQISLENWNLYMRNDLDSLKLDGLHIYRLGVKGGNPFAIHVGKRSLGSYLIRTGNQEKGIEYLKAANFYFNKKENYILQTETLNEIGNGYLYFSKPRVAEKYYLKSLKCGKKSPDPTSAFLAEVNLAQAYIDMGNTTKATAILNHYKNQAKKMKKLESVSNAYALLGAIQSGKGKFSLSKELFRKSAYYGFASNAIAQIAHAYTNMAIVYFQEGNQKEALNYFNKSLEIRLKTKNVRSISESYFNLGEYYSGIGDVQTAALYYEKCKAYCEENNLLKEEMEVLLSLINIDKMAKNFEIAVQKMEGYIALQKKYYSEVSELNTRDRDIIEIVESLEREEYDKKEAQKLEESIAAQRFQKYVLYAIFSLCAIALVLLAFYRKKII